MESNTKVPSWLASSANATQVSMTMRGIIVAFIPLLIAVLNNAGVEVTETQIDEVVGMITAAVSSLMIAYGLLRKVFFFVKGLYTQLKRIDGK